MRASSEARESGRPRDIYGTAAIGADGTVYFSSESRCIYAFTAAGSLKEKFDIYSIVPETHGSSSIVKSSLAIADDGTIYAGDFYYSVTPHQGALYALRSESKGLASTPWPRFRKTSQNTGRY